MQAESTGSRRPAPERRAPALWDAPGTLNAVAGVLFAAALLLALYAAGLILLRQPAFQLREVRLAERPAHVSAEDLEAVVRSELRGNFFTLDLAATRIAFERLPWVRRVELRRQWPDRLEVALEEHVPLARWGRNELVNVHGEVFRGAYQGALPLFEGPAGTAKEIAIQYEYFRRSLAAIGQAPGEVRVSPRRAWQVKLQSGLILELGREQVESRLARFIGAYDRTVGPLGRRLDYVDLRYPNGFAVRVSGFKPERRPGSGRGAS
jgi:cell division protein FtsQ